MREKTGSSEASFCGYDIHVCFLFAVHDVLDLKIWFSSFIKFKLVINDSLEHLFLIKTSEFVKPALIHLYISDKCSG